MFYVSISFILLNTLYSNIVLIEVYIIDIALSRFQVPSKEHRGLRERVFQMCMHKVGILYSLCYIFGACVWHLLFSNFL